MDRELVIRARGGDHDAFARLAAGSIGRLNALARLILTDYARAEDAVQDAFVDAWQDLRGLRDPDRFDAWLNRLLIRACQNARRRDRRRQAIELPLLTDGPPPTSAGPSSVRSESHDHPTRRRAAPARPLRGACRPDGR